MVQTRERKVLTAKELAVRHQKGSKITGFEYLGGLPDLWTVLVYGPPGEGKSTYALLLASALGEKTLFFAVEEGQSESLIRKLINWEIRNDQVLISDAREAREIRQDLADHSPSLMVLDSITALGFTMKHSKTVWVAQSTKSGGFRGSQEVAHDADIVVQLEGGLAIVKKSRFGETGEFKFREVER